MTDTTNTRPMLGDTLPKTLKDWQALYIKTRGERDTAREAVDQIEQTRDDFGQQLIEARREIAILRATNAAQSDMLRGAAAAAAQREQERVALHKLIASVLVDLDSQSPMWCKVLLRAMRREYAEIVAEANHA